MKIIDTCKQPDGTYLDSDGCTWSDLESFIQGHLLGFCCCYLPEANIRYVRDSLALLDGWRNKKVKAANFHSTYLKDRKKAVEHFKTPEAENFMWYWLDSKGFTEHGGAIPGWLTDKGKELLAIMNEYIAAEDLEDEIDK